MEAKPQEEVEPSCRPPGSEAAALPSGWEDPFLLDRKAQTAAKYSIRFQDALKTVRRSGLPAPSPAGSLWPQPPRVSPIQGPSGSSAVSALKERDWAISGDTPSGRDTTRTGVPFSSRPEVSQQIPFCRAQKSSAQGLHHHTQEELSGGPSLGGPQGTGREKRPSPSKAAPSAGRRGW